MSAALTGYARTPEHRANMSAALKGNHPSPEARTKMSAAHLGRTLTPEHRAAISAALNAPSMLARISASHRKPLTPEHREAIRNAPVKGECSYCGLPATSTDHVIPRGRQGWDDPANEVIACLRCNQSKGVRTPEEWLAAGLYAHV